MAIDVTAKLAWAEQVWNHISLESVSELEAQMNDLELANFKGQESVWKNVSYLQSVRLGIDYWDQKKSLSTTGESQSGLKTLGAHFRLANYQLQAVGGVFRPLLFGCSKEEFTNTQIITGTEVQ